MPSPAFTTWSTESAAALSQLEEIAAAGVGERQELNYAYVLRLCAHFQAYARSLHADAAQAVLDALGPPPSIAAMLDANLSFARQLDRRNAQPATLSADFRRLDIELWPAVEFADPANAARRRRLDELNAWRNAIAHNDIDGRRAELVPQELTAVACREWRIALAGLAKAFDRALTEHLQTLIGACPW